MVVTPSESAHPILGVASNTSAYNSLVGGGLSIGDYPKKCKNLLLFENTLFVRAFKQGFNCPVWYN